LKRHRLHDVSPLQCYGAMGVSYDPLLASSFELFEAGVITSLIFVAFGVWMWLGMKMQALCGYVHGGG
jgi:hypothetical protein